MSPQWRSVVAAAENMEFMYPKHLCVFGYVRNWPFFVCAWGGERDKESERAAFTCTHAGHQSAVNFRPSRGTATKSIIEVMNVLLSMGISV